MPFMVMNFRATFQNMMDRILANVENVKYYVDDIVIYSVTKEKDIGLLGTVLKLLRKHGL